MRLTERKREEKGRGGEGRGGDFHGGKMKGNVEVFEDNNRLEKRWSREVVFFFHDLFLPPSVIDEYVWVMSC